MDMNSKPSPPILNFRYHSSNLIFMLFYKPDNSQITCLMFHLWKLSPSFKVRTMARYTLRMAVTCLHWGQIVSCLQRQDLAFSCLVTTVLRLTVSNRENIIIYINQHTHTTALCYTWTSTLLHVKVINCDTYKDVNAQEIQNMNTSNLYVGLMYVVGQ